MVIETERETDGRWIAEVLDVPGALAYGATEQEAIESAVAIARTSPGGSGLSAPHHQPIGTP